MPTICNPPISNTLFNALHYYYCYNLDRRRRDQDLYFSRKGLAHVHETKLQQAVLAVQTMDEEVGLDLSTLFQMILSLLSLNSLRTLC